MPPLRSGGAVPSQSCISAVVFQAEFMPPERPSRRPGQCSKCYRVVGQQMQAQLPGGPSGLCSSQVDALLWDPQGAVEGQNSLLCTTTGSPSSVSLWILTTSLMFHLRYLLCLEPSRLYLPSRWPRISMFDAILELLSNAIHGRNIYLLYLLSLERWVL